MRTPVQLARFLWLGFCLLLGWAGVCYGQVTTKSYDYGGGHARNGRWTSAEDQFVEAIKKEDREGLQNKVYVTENLYYFDWYPHLGRGNALLQLALETKDDSQANQAKKEELKAARIRQAVSELGRSLVESPNIAALWLLARAYLAGGALYAKDLDGLLKAGEFTFSNEAWSLGGRAPNSKGRGNLGSVVVSYTYDSAAAKVRATLSEALPVHTAASEFTRKFAEAKPGDLAVLSPTDAAALGEAKGKPSKSKLKVTDAANAWAAFTASIPVLPEIRVNGKQLAEVDKLAGKIRIAAMFPAGVTLGDWKLVDGESGNAPVIGNGTSGTPIRTDWDTEVGSVTDALHTLVLFYQYTIGNQLKQGRVSFPVNVSNPAPDVKLEASISDNAENRELTITLQSTRRLLEPSCTLQTTANGIANPPRSLSLVNVGENGTAFRFLYQRTYLLPDEFEGAVKIEGEFQPAVGKPITKEINPPVPPILRAKLGVSESEVASSTGSKPVVVSISTNNPVDLDDLEAEVQFSNGKSRPLQLSKASPAGDRFQATFKPEAGDPEGTAAIVFQVRKRRFGRPTPLLIVQEGPELQTVLAELGRTVREGEQTDVYLGFSRPVELPLRVTFRHPGGGTFEETCQPAPERGANVYRCVFAPKAPGRYTLALTGAQDRFGLSARVAAGLALDFAVTQQIRLRLRVADVVPAGPPARVYVSVEGGEAQPEVRVIHPGGRRNPTPLQPATPARDSVTGEYVFLLEVAPDQEESVTLIATPKGGQEDAGDRRTVRLDGRAPSFSVSGLPTVLTDTAERLVVIRALEDLAVGTTPEVSLQQVNAADTPLLLEEVTGQRNEWRVRFNVQPINGNAAISVRGRDRAGNLGEQLGAFEVDIPVVPVTVIPDSPRWGEGRHTIRLRPRAKVEGALQLQIMLPSATTAKPIPLRAQGAEFVGEFDVLPQMHGRARLEVRGAGAGTAVVDLDTQAPTPTLRLPDEAKPGATIRIVVTADEPLSEATVTVTEPTGEKKLSLAPSGGDWSLDYQLPANAPRQLNFQAAVKDEVGLVSRSGNQSLRVEAPVWDLIIPRVARAGRLEVKVTTNVANAGGAPRVQIRAKDGTLLLSVPLLTRDKGATWSGVTDVTRSVPVGSADVVLLLGDMTLRRTSILLDAEPPVVAARTAPLDDKTRYEIVASLQNRDSILGETLPASIDWTRPGASSPEKVMLRRTTPGSFTFRAEIDAEGVRDGKYTVTIEAVDEAGNMGQGTTLLVVEPKTFQLDWESPVAGKTYTDLPQVVCRLQGANPENYELQFILTKTDDPMFKPVTLLRGGNRVGQRLVFESTSAQSGSLQLKLPPNLRRGDYQLEAQLIPIGSAVARQIEGERARTFTYEPIVAVKDQRWAIIVAIQNYTDAQLPPLKMPYFDAATLYASLIRRGYREDHILVYTDADPGMGKKLPVTEIAARTRSSLVKAMSSAVERVGKEGGKYLVIGYVGHGGQDAGKTYLMPQDASLKLLSETAIDVQRLVEFVDQFNKLKSSDSNIENLLLIADACRNQVTPGVIKPGLPASETLKTFNYYHSCDVGEVAIEVTQPGNGLDFTGGIFTQSLVELLDRGGFKDWNEFDEALAEIVKVRAGFAQKVQRPQRFAYPALEAKKTLTDFFELPKGPLAAVPGNKASFIPGVSRIGVLALRSKLRQQLLNSTASLGLVRAAL